MESFSFNSTEPQSRTLEDLHKRADDIIKTNFQNLQGASGFYLNLNALTRFLIAREYKLEPALLMWKNWVTWHSTYQPNKISETEECVKNNLGSSKLLWHKHDKLKRPCLYYRMKYHQSGLSDIDGTLRYLIYMVEKGLEEADRLGSGQIVVLYDRRGFNKKNYDKKSMEAMKKLVPILQEYYPERLGIYFVAGANWFFKAMFSVVKTFMNKKTVEKVKLLGDDKELLAFFNLEELLVDYGGKSQIQKAEEKVEFEKLKAGQGDDDDAENDEEFKKLQEQMLQDAGVNLNEVE